MSGPKITVDEIRDLFESLSRDRKNGDGMTSREWGEALGFGMNKTRDLLRRFIQDGKMRSENVLRDDVMRPGRTYTTTVYTWIGEDQGAA